MFLLSTARGWKFYSWSKEYAFSNTIDAVEIVDALGQVMVFP